MSWVGAAKTAGGDHCPACRQTCCIQSKSRHHKCDSSTEWLTLPQAMPGNLGSSPFSVVPVCNAWSQSPLPELTGDTCTACTESHACLMLNQDQKTCYLPDVTFPVLCWLKQDVSMIIRYMSRGTHANQTFMSRLLSAFSTFCTDSGTAEYN